MPVFSREFINLFRKYLTLLNLISRCQPQTVRVQNITKWAHNGGALIIGYELFRHIMDPKNKNTMSCQLNGTHIIFCDEGHILRNPKSMLFSFVQQMKTHRKFLLTGTPLQNNLFESKFKNF